MIERFFMGPFAKINYNIFIKEVNGLENIPEGEGFIVAANHASYMDIVGLSAAFLSKKSINIRYLAKKELFSIWLFRWLKGIFNGIPVDRKLKGKKALKQAVEALKKGDVVGIYPEGSRSLTGKIQKGKTGVARLALWAKAPVVPVGIKGSFELMPMGKLIPKIKKNIILNIGKPIYFNKYYNRKITKELLRQLTDKVMEEIAKLSYQRYNP